ncbi:MAG: right-handed parallel beta-helix repeat-containing protein, partial [Sphingobacteriaceae bacterium]
MSTTSVEYLDNIGQLKLLVPTAGTNVAIVEDIDRGGTFTYESALPSGLSTEGILTFKAPTGGWIRQFSESDAVNVLWAGAKGDAVIGLTGSTTTTTLTSSTAIFGSSSSDLSAKTLIIAGGRLFGGSVYGDLVTKVTWVSSTQVTLSTAASIMPPTTITAATVVSGGSLPNATYAYKVVAYSLYGNSLASSSVNATINSSNRSVNVTWNAVPGAMYYRLYRGTTGYFTTNLLSYKDTGATVEGTTAVPTTNNVKFIWGTDDTAAIQKVLNLPYNVIFPAERQFLISYGLFADGIDTSTSSFPPASPITNFYPGSPYSYPTSAHVSQRKIFADGSTIVRSNNSHALMWKGSVSDYTVEGGKWLCPYPIQGVKDIFNTTNISCFHFYDRGSNTISISNVHIAGSPEGGIAFNGVVNATVSENTIQSTWRDGIYAQYSCYLKYLNNTLSNIKDDAMSIHDYGKDSDRDAIKTVDVYQGGQSVVAGNIVTNAWEGFSSAGGAVISIYGNEFMNTMNPGINIFNMEFVVHPLQPEDIYQYYVESGTRVNQISINDNIFKNNCRPFEFLPYPGATQGIFQNVGYNSSNMDSTGRAALVLASYKRDDLAPVAKPVTDADQVMRSNGISIQGNKFYNSGTNAVLVHNIDGLTLSNNYA